MSSTTESDSPAVRLEIFSHGHSPPLHPAADIKYDLRKVPNPTRYICQNFNGTSKRLRDYMLHIDEFTRMLDRARAEIEDRISHMDRIGKLEHDEAPTSMNSNVKSQTSSDRTASDDSPLDQELTIRISCFCHIGQHRSVAFAEELAASDWPKTYTVTLHHRDVGLSKADRGKGWKVKGKGKRDVLGASSVNGNDDDR